MSEIKTKKEIAIEFRNALAFRCFEREANIIYWKSVVRASKANSPEIVEAINSVKDNETRLKKDLIFLDQVDEMIKKGNY